MSTPFGFSDPSHICRQEEATQLRRFLESDGDDRQEEKTCEGCQNTNGQ